MSRLFTLAIAAVVLSISIASMSCDDYNIVEPRFYDEDDVRAIPDEHGPGGWCPLFPDTTGIQPKNLIPNLYYHRVAWHDRAARTLLVEYGVPKSGNVELTLINSGGGLIARLASGQHDVGNYVLGYVIDEAGIYGVSMEAGFYARTNWYRVE